MINKITLIFAIICGAIGAYAQSPTPATSPTSVSTGPVNTQSSSGQLKQVAGGVLNGKALSLPKPAYPANAKAANISGTVSVEVLINEEGNVVSAVAVSGQAILRSPAEKAASGAKFSPTLLEGKPVKVSGVITYNFVLPTADIERLETTKLASFLYMVRGSVRDLNGINKAMGTPDFVRSALGDFPKQMKALAPLSDLSSVPVDKRVGIVDGVIAAVTADLGPAEVWQFELGKNIGECFSLLFASLATPEIDLSAIDEPSLRSSITKIRAMANEPPRDLPPDILQKLKDIGEMSDKKPLATGENLLQLLSRIESFIDTISSENDK